MGLPAIVTNINGCNEIIKHNYNGIIIQSKSVGELECSMKILLENNKLRNYLATNARENIVQRYDQQFLWNALLGEYQQLEKEYYSKKKKHAQ
jgi:glycosyltransferase involved in cell wall biosynthesis